MSLSEYSIGYLARVTGCKVTTIRYFEKIGLMPAPYRTAGNQRRYGPIHVSRLVFIQHCRELGFDQQAIAGLLRLTEYPNNNCASVTEIARTHLREVNLRISRLAVLKSELERMVEVCCGGKISDCRIIEKLDDYSHSHID